VREVVGVLMFLLALAVGASVILPADAQPKDPRPVSLGRLEGQTTPDPGGSFTLAQPVQWDVAFFRQSAPEGSAAVKSERLPALVLSYPAAPFAGVDDDAWRMRAEGNIEARPGTYTFTLIHTGPVRVRIGDRDAGEAGFVLAPERLQIAFRHPGGVVQIMVDSQDEGGAFELKWE
jgi:hypothetical protein